MNCILNSLQVLNLCTWRIFLFKKKILLKTLLHYCFPGVLGTSHCWRSTYWIKTQRRGEHMGGGRENAACNARATIIWCIFTVALHYPLKYINKSLNIYIYIYVYLVFRITRFRLVGVPMNWRTNPHQSCPLSSARPHYLTNCIL